MIFRVWNLLLCVPFDALMLLIKRQVSKICSNYAKSFCFGDLDKPEVTAKQKAS